MAGKYRGNGEGTISQRKDGRWVARYHVRTADGPRRKAIYAKSRSEAATKLALAIADRNGSGPITVEPSKLPVSEYLAEWLAAKKPELAADTHRRYTSIVEGRISPALGSLVVADLRRAHVEPGISLDDPFHISVSLPFGGVPCTPLVARRSLFSLESLVFVL